MTTLSVEAKLCTHLISPKSLCSSCVDHCPMKSISFKESTIQIDESCVDCGLCTTVCPTNALMYNRPPLKQLVSEIVHKCEQHEKVYLHCERIPIRERNATTVTVSCLGVIPKEAWVTMIGKCENLSVFHPDGGCNSCQMMIGEKIWRKELSSGEGMVGKQMKITSIIESNKQKAQYDKGRRAFLSTIFNEFKTTNKVAIKEMAGGSPVQSYKEKIQDDPILKVKKEWEEMSNRIVEKMTNESVYPYMNKRRLFLTELQNNDTLQRRKDIRLPTISPDCDFCSACTILCPTNALLKENKNGQTTITLQPYKCVDCSLCEDICFSKSINLQYESNSMLLSEAKVLVKK